LCITSLGKLEADISSDEQGIDLSGDHSAGAEFGR